MTSPCGERTWALAEEAAPSWAQTAGAWEKQMYTLQNNRGSRAHMGSVQVGGGSRHQGIPALFREGASPGDVFPASQQTCVLPPGSPAPPSAFVFLPKPSVGEQGGEALSAITLPWVRVLYVEARPGQPARRASEAMSPTALSCCISPHRGRTPKVKNYRATPWMAAFPPRPGPGTAG